MNALILSISLSLHDVAKREGDDEMAMATKATKDGTAAGDKAPHLPRNTRLPLLLFTKAVNEEIHDRRMYYMCVCVMSNQGK